ncbi:MAG: hypothetical protein P8X74_22310, partial [Reinekea sp.]
ESSTAPVRRRKPRAKGLPPAKERFLAGLEAYGQGVQLKDCSETLLFTAYISDNGIMVRKGIPLYNQLSDAEKMQLDQAIIARQIRLADKETVKERFLAGLEAYGQGAQLKDCSATLSFKNYVTDDGVLHQAGKDVCKGLSAEDLDRVNQALLRRNEFYFKRAMDNAPVDERFLAGLENYARGARLADCSATLSFKNYVTHNGLLHPPGAVLRKNMSAEDQARVDDALLRRSSIYSDYSKRAKKNTTPVEERFLASLDNYAQGLLLSECSKDIPLRSYLTDDGRLLPGRGLPLYNRLSRDDQERVDKALAARGKIYAQHNARDVAKFMATLEPYGNGLSLQECGTFSGLKKKASVYLTPEGGLTYKGQRLIENLQPDQLNKVLEAIEKRQQNTGLNPPVLESAWQWPEMPASMPETEGMDPTAMYTPMSTEAMMAAAWQYTGQTMPGTWGIPWESAEPSIPHYGSDVVGSDFRHRYGSNGLMPQRAPDRLIGLGIVHDTLINIQGEEYRVHDTGRRSVNLTNENPQGKIIMLVPRMRGG